MSTPHTTTYLAHKERERNELVEDIRLLKNRLAYAEIGINEEALIRDVIREKQAKVDHINQELGHATV